MLQGRGTKIKSRYMYIHTNKVTLTKLHYYNPYCVPVRVNTQFQLINFWLVEQTLDKELVVSYMYVTCKRILQSSIAKIKEES